MSGIGDLLRHYKPGTPQRRTLEACIEVRASFKKGGFAQALEDHYSIVDKAGRLHRIKLNEEQQQLASFATDSWLQHKAVWMMMLKARQIGVSTWIQGVTLIMALLRARWRSQTVAHLEDLAQHLADMGRTALANWPSGEVELAIENRAASKFHQPSESSSSIVTAQNLGAGRGRTISLIHASEVSFYPNAETLMLGLLQQVPDTGCMVFLESTANGAGGYFFECWNASQEGKSRYKSFFFPWWQHAEYRLDFTGEAEKRSFCRSLTEEETALERDFKIEPEQLHWRRFAIRDKAKGDPRLFQQEYPASPEEAFLTSGRPAFEPDQMRKLLELARKSPPIAIGYLQECNPSPPTAATNASDFATA